MRTAFEIPVDEVAPSPRAVLGGLGIPAAAAPGERTEVLLGTALALVRARAAPRAVLADVSAADFDEIYRGEGRNEPATPLGQIFPRGERLALFAVTIGPEVGRAISELFASREFALASMLDAAASEATENAGDVLERRIRGEDPATAALRYSPGYCGWHVSGQRRLFAALRPEEIGIRLRESFLMEPLKSMSGVIVAGPGAIHDFEDAYPFCAECVERGCRARIRRVVHGR